MLSPAPWEVSSEPQQAEPSLADIAERLMAEFSGQVNLSVISRVVQESRKDLQGAPPGALPELTERLARQRLLAQTGRPVPEDPGDRFPSPRPHHE